MSLFCVIRLTGPSNVQSKMMLVVSQRKRGLSFALEARGRLFAELGQLGAAVEPRPGSAATASASAAGAGRVVRRA